MDKLTKKEKKELRHLEHEEKINKELKRVLYKKIGIWTTAIVVFCLAIWGLILITNNPLPPEQKVATLPSVNAKDIVIGTSSAKVTLTEYADFQCPACGAYHEVIKQVLEKYGNDIQYVYRNYPLSMHQNAKAAAYTAYAAYKQGEFREMEDLLYANQKDWSSLENPGDIFNQYAEQIGLDMTKFNEDIASEETKKFITDQENAAITLGINSTPTFFVNKDQIQAPPSFEEFNKIIEDAINKK
jgi:protein-disulfide isomerase